MSKARRSPRKDTRRRDEGSKAGQGGSASPVRTPLAGRRVLVYLASLALLVLVSFSTKVLVLSRAGTLSIAYPFDGALFPPEIIAPTVWWEDRGSDATHWHVRIEFESGGNPCEIEAVCPSRTGLHRINAAMRHALDGISLADIAAPQVKVRAPAQSSSLHHQSGAKAHR